MKKKKKYDGLCQDPSGSVLKHGPRLLADRRGLGKHRLQGRTNETPNCNKLIYN